MWSFDYSTIWWLQILKLIPNVKPTLKFQCSFIFSKKTVNDKIGFECFSENLSTGKESAECKITTTTSYSVHSGACFLASYALWKKAWAGMSFYFECLRNKAKARVIHTHQIMSLSPFFSSCFKPFITSISLHVEACDKVDKRRSNRKNSNYIYQMFDNSTEILCNYLRIHLSPFSRCYFQFIDEIHCRKCISHAYGMSLVT